MTMPSADEVMCVVLSNACRLNAKPNIKKLIEWRLTTIDNSATLVGSVSELYIEPPTLCIRDINAIKPNRSAIAVPSTLHIPKHLPSTFDDNVTVYETFDAEFRADYQHLRVIGKLVKVSAEGDERVFISSSEPLDDETSLSHDGRQLEIELDSRLNELDRKIYVDFTLSPVFSQPLRFVTVHTVRCLSWPTQAAEWTTRSRNGGWPLAPIIERVVVGGCDLVRVAQHQNRENESITIPQWKFSFARAETVLLNTWTPIQQTIYHILRCLLNGSSLGRSDKKNGESQLSVYHIKTLMLWTCERKHPDWWFESNTVQISSYIVRFLLKCCKSRQCRGYFIRSYMLDCNVSRSQINQLKLFSEPPSLAKWLMNNYVDQCIQQSPDELKTELRTSLQLSGVQSESRRHQAINSVIKWILGKFLNISLIDMVMTMYYISLVCGDSRITLDQPVIARWKTDLDSIDERLFSDYVTPIICLRLVSVIDEHKNEWRENVCDVLTTVTLSDCDRVCATTDCSEILLSKAIYLIEVSRRTSDQTLRSIFLFMCYIHLHRALKFLELIDGDTMRAVHLLTNVQVAVLCYTAGNYRKAVEHCELVMQASRQTKSPTIPCVLEGNSLPKFNDEFDSVNGLMTLYAFFQNRAVNGELQIRYTGVFTAQLFAYFVCHLCQSRPTRCDKGHSVIRRYRICLYEASSLFCGDLLLFYISSTKNNQLYSYQHRTVSASRRLQKQFGDNKLRKLLTIFAVDRLTLFFETISSYYRADCRITTTDAQAMHYLQCQRYEQCQKLSQQNFNSLVVSSSLRFPVPIIGCLTQLMDDDIVCLVAVVLLASKENFFEVLTQITLSLYLYVKSELHLRPAKSFRDELNHINVLHSNCAAHILFDTSLLKFLYRKVIMHIKRYAKHSKLM
jgi:Mab-21 protein